MEDSLAEEFVKYAKDKYGLDIKLIPVKNQEDADTFEKIFWTNIEVLDNFLKEEANNV